jgi:hypothetical protein
MVRAAAGVVFLVCRTTILLRVAGNPAEWSA